jgi:hypothetical protein
MINILLPVMILDYCSGEAQTSSQFWKIGPLWALVLALLLPFCYGIYSLCTEKKINFMSTIGLIGVLLTGLISLLVIDEQGGIHPFTPWLFASKEAMIPLILSAVVFFSRNTATPMLNTFIYTPDLFNTRRIEQTVASLGKEQEYKKLLNGSSMILTGTLIASAVANFFLSMNFMNAVLELPADNRRLAYNEAIGSITWWGFLIIGIPILIAFVYILYRLIQKLIALTGLSKKEILSTTFIS